MAADTFIAAAAFLAASILVTAGVLKLGDLAGFSAQVAAYQIASRRLSLIIGHVLPPIEIAVGVGLLVTPRIFGVVAALLFVAFAVAIAINLMRGRRRLICGCFGRTGSRRISGGHVVINALLAATTLLSAMTGARPSVESLVIGTGAVLFIVTARAIARIWIPITPVGSSQTREA